jgi:hypothetical protein
MARQARGAGETPSWSRSGTVATLGFHVCFKDISRTFQGHFKDISSISQAFSMLVPSLFRACFKDISRSFQGCSKHIPGTFMATRLPLPPCPRSGRPSLAGTLAPPPCFSRPVPKAGAGGTQPPSGGASPSVGAIIHSADDLSSGKLSGGSRRAQLDSTTILRTNRARLGRSLALPERLV